MAAVVFGHGKLFPRGIENKMPEKKPFAHHAKPRRIVVTWCEPRVLGSDLETTIAQHLTTMEATCGARSPERPGPDGKGTTVMVR